MSSNLTKKQIEHLARLSNLMLSSSEEEKIADQFDKTLDYVSNLDELDTSASRDSYHMSGKHDIFFKDGEPNTRALDVAKMPSTTVISAKRYFVVKKIL